ncbi:MAG: amidohydrolase family protein [Candidatus Latescibacterota bacterium]|nr:amidohydrolase family protein [Candidatus Latescibacterota bacterium]
MIIDAHSHIFPEVHGEVAGGLTRSAGYGRIKIGKERVLQLMPPHGRETTFPLEAMLANLHWAGVRRAVLLQGTYYGECDDYVGDAVAAYPDRLVGALWCDPWRKGFREYFEEKVDSGRYAIGKIEFSVGNGLSGLHPGARLDDPEVQWLWSELARRGMTLTLDLGPTTKPAYQTDAVRALIAANPDLRVVLAHLCFPHPRFDSEPELRRRWEDQLSLVDTGQVWFDTASLPALVQEQGGVEDFPYPTVAVWLAEGIDRVGVDRLMWGTDQPGMLHHLNYPQMLRLAQLHMEHLSSEEREMVLGDTAKRVYFHEA